MDEDTENKAQSRHIKDLHNRREEMLDDIKMVARADTSSELSGQDARVEFVASLRSLLIDIYPLVVDAFEPSDDDEKGPWQWFHDEEIATFEVDPPEHVPMDPAADPLRPHSDPPAPKSYTVEGLLWFIDTAIPITEEWTVPYSSGGEIVTRQVMPPLQACIQAAKLTAQTMGEMGIGADVQPDMGEAEFDYSDVLQRGPPPGDPAHDPERWEKYGPDTTEGEA